MTALGARRWWALGALNLVVLAVALPVTVVSVALPTLAGALHASTSDLQWFVSAYSLGAAAALLPGGLLGDRYGRKKVLLGALVVDAGGSVAAATATSPGAFIAAQAVLGLAAGFVVPLVLSALTVLFDEAERPRAVGIWAAANFVALPLGPILGGWMLSTFWWGWVYLMNLPVIAVALAVGAALLPETRSAHPHGLDMVGMLASTAGLTVLTYGLITAGQNGWGSAGALVTMAGGALALVAFALWERWLDRRPAGQPLIDPGLFGSRRFTWGAILAGVASFALAGILFSAPQYFQAILGADAMGSGVRLLPLLAGIVAGSVTAGRVAARSGARTVVALGFAVLAAALVVGTATGVTSGYGLAAVWTSAVGLGTGLVLTTATSAAVGELAAERAGVGSATLQAIQRLGPPMAAAVLGSALNAGYHGDLDLAGVPAPVAGVARESVFAGIEAARQLGSAPLLEAVRSAFVHGLDAMLWASAGIAAAGAVLALLFLPRRPEAAGATEPSEHAEPHHETSA